MKVYEIALGLILINFSFGIITALDITRTSFPNDLADKLNESLIMDSVEGSQETLSLTDQLLDYYTFTADAFKLFFTIVYDLTLGIPNALASPPFSFPPVLVNTLRAGCIFVYALGIISMFRGMEVR